MDKIQPQQLVGLLFAVALVVAAVLALNWRSELAAFGRAAFSLARRGFAYLFYVTLQQRAGSSGNPAGAGTNSAPVVLAQQHQAASAPVPDFEAVLDFLAKHNLTDEQAIDLFATAHRASDDYFISANKLRDAIGGNEAAVKARVASRRPKPPAPRPAARLERPVNGW
jgi:hypothetical protein